MDPEVSGNCRTKIQEIETLEKRPIVTCVHKNITQCHYSYITKYTPTPQQVATTFQSFTGKRMILVMMHLPVKYPNRDREEFLMTPCDENFKGYFNLIYTEKG